MEDKDFKL